MIDTSVFKTISLLLAQGKIGLFHQNTHVFSGQSCPILCDPTDCSLPDSPVLGILQARILEWVDISFSRGSSQPRTESPSPAQQVDSFTTVLSEQTDKILNSVKYLIYVKISLFFPKICHYREMSGKVKHNLTLFILLFSGIEILEVLI